MAFDAALFLHFSIQPDGGMAAGTALILLADIVAALAASRRVGLVHGVLKARRFGIRCAFGRRPSRRMTFAAVLHA